MLVLGYLSSSPPWPPGYLLLDLHHPFRPGLPHSVLVQPQYPVVKTSKPPQTCPPGVLHGFPSQSPFLALQATSLTSYTYTSCHCRQHRHRRSASTGASTPAATSADTHSSKSPTRFAQCWPAFPAPWPSTSAPPKTCSRTNTCGLPPRHSDRYAPPAEPPGAPPRWQTSTHTGPCPWNPCAP